MDDIKGGWQIPNFLWSGLIATSVAIIGYISYGPPLVSQRPRDTTITKPAEPVESDSVLTRHARLWEDPLTWACQAGERKDSDEREDFTINFHEVQEGKLPLILPVLLRGSPDAHSQEERVRCRYAVLAALATARYRPESASTIRHLAVSRSEGKRWLVPYELFSPDLTESSRGYDRRRAFDQVLVCWLDESLLGSRPLAGIRDLINTLYSHRNLESLHQVACGQPDDAGVLQVGVVGPSGSDLLVNMAIENREIRLGPEYFHRPLVGRCASQEENTVAVHVYSPRATIEPAVLQPTPERELRALTQRSIQGVEPSPPGKSCVTFTDVIGTDWHLLYVLREELTSRGRWPNPFASNEEIVVVTEMDSAYGRGIARLIDRLFEPAKLWIQENGGTAEDPVRLTVKSACLESLYGVGLTLRVESGNAGGTRDCELTSGQRCVAKLRLRPSRAALEPGGERWWTVSLSEGSPAGRIRLNTTPAKAGLPNGEWLPRSVPAYKYLRGIDGKKASAGDSEKATTGGSGKARAEGLASAMSTNDYPPTGTSQFDYLRRMEAELTELHASHRRAGGKGILAIGVMGTDVYDKLLILRSLRPRFPGVCFFTTDLDAEYVRVSERPFTRNLLVASHFGLTLHPWLQREAPPFRDVYQTSTFLATLLAVKDRRAKDLLEWWTTMRTTAGRPNDGWFWPPPVARLDGGEKRATAADVPPWLDRDPWLPVSRDSSRMPPGERKAAETTDAYWRRSCLAPLLFEIGYSAPYQLSETCEGEAPRSLPRIGESGEAAGSTGEGSPGIQAIVQPPSPRQARLFPPRRTMGVVALLILLSTFAYFSLSAARRFLGPIVGTAWLLIRSVWCVACVVLLTVAAWIMWLALAGDARAVRVRARCKSLARSAIGWGAAPSNMALFKGVVVLVAIWIGCRFALFLSGEHSSTFGEPFAWAEGISIWPSTLIRFGVVVLTLSFLWVGMRDLQKDAVELFGGESPPGRWHGLAQLVESRAAFCDALRVHDLRCPETASSPGGAASVLDRYCLKASPPMTLARSVAWAVLCLGVTSVLFWVVGELPNMPARNDMAASWGNWVLGLSVFSSTCLAFFVIDATSLCRRLVTALGTLDVSWPNLSTLLDDAELALDPDTADGLATVRAVARRTDVVSKLLLYPFWTVLLLILARHSVFDGWDVPPTLLGIVLALLLLIVVHAILLRHEAAKTRTVVVKRLRRRLLTAAAGQEADRIKWVIEEVERQRDGAFRPFGEDSLFKALAILSSGGAGLLLLEQLLPHAW